MFCRKYRYIGIDMPVVRLWLFAAVLLCFCLLLLIPEGFQELYALLDGSEGIFVPVKPSVSLVGVFRFCRGHSILRQHG